MVTFSAEEFSLVYIFLSASNYLVRSKFVAESLVVNDRCQCDMAPDPFIRKHYLCNCL